MTITSPLVLLLSYPGPLSLPSPPTTCQNVHFAEPPHRLPSKTPFSPKHWQHWRGRGERFGSFFWEHSSSPRRTPPHWYKYTPSHHTNPHTAKLPSHTTLSFSAAQYGGVLPALPTPTSRLGAEARQKYSGKEGGGRTPQRVGPLRFYTNPLPRYRCARDPDRDWSANGRPRTVL